MKFSLSLSLFILLFFVVACEKDLCPNANYGLLDVTPTQEFFDCMIAQNKLYYILIKDNVRTDIVIDSVDFPYRYFDHLDSFSRTVDGVGWIDRSCIDYKFSGNTYECSEDSTDPKKPKKYRGAILTYHGS